MKKILKFNNIPIWNLVDLQREFSPMAALTQLKAYEEFVKVHCIPLPLMLENEDERYEAYYLTKEFWKKILQNVEWPQMESAEAGLKYFLKLRYEDEIGGPAEERQIPIEDDSVREDITLEVRDSQVFEKLHYICESGKYGATDDEIRKAILLLAICEIAEISALSQQFQNVQQTVSTGTQKDDVKTHTEIEEFPFEENAPLVASEKAYRYWYHDEDHLLEGESIRTVCVKAQMGSNQYAKVMIELYSTVTKALIQTLVLDKDEYRYCNVAGGRIIQFLPLESQSPEISLIRKEADRSEITVKYNGEEPWTLHQNGASCWAAGDKDTGFLLIQNGTANAAFYKPAAEYLVQLKLDMIALPVVEVQIKDGDYQLLTSEGTILSGRASAQMLQAVALNRDML